VHQREDAKVFWFFSSEKNKILLAAHKEKSQAFFSEEKNQKTFTFCARSRILDLAGKLLCCAGG
jgi:hypothetical protein